MENSVSNLYQTDFYLKINHNMDHRIISNIPKIKRELYDLAKSESYDFWIDEKGTVDNPGVWQRKSSKLSYEDAFTIIENNKPHWTISFRNESYFNENLQDYFEFSGCNLKSNEYGEVFIWIKVSVEKSLEIFKKYNLNLKSY